MGRSLFTTVILVLAVLAAGPAFCGQAPPASASVDTAPVFVIPIHGEINRPLVAFIQRAVREAKKERATYVIFDMDTWGGAADATFQITTLIKSLRPAVTVAYVTAAATEPGFLSQAPGTGASLSAGSTAWVAYDSAPAIQATRSPGATAVTPAPACSTVPAPSLPMPHGRVSLYHPERR